METNIKLKKSKTMGIFIMKIKFSNKNVVPLQTVPG